ncbi:MAG: hypothetical protein WCF09_07715, partial [Gallionella sp.]
MLTATRMQNHHDPASPFDLESADAYLGWRDQKLAHAITDTGELIVEIGDLSSLSKAEHAALGERCRRSNMAIYAARNAAVDEAPVDEETVRRFGLEFGLDSLDANWLAGERGITRVTVSTEDG